MGLIARVLSSVRRTVRGTPVTDVKSSAGASVNVTPQLFLPPGDDARPLPGDYEYLGSTPRAGGWAVLGFQDASNAGVTNPGEKRIYARDASGAVVAQVYLQNDGQVTVENDNGSVDIWPNGDIDINAGDVALGLTAAGAATLDNGSGTLELLASGTVDINGVQIDPAGNISTPGTVTAADFITGVITLLQHKHNGVTPGSGTSGTPVP